MAVEFVDTRAALGVSLQCVCVFAGGTVPVCVCVSSALFSYMALI